MVVAQSLFFLRYVLTVSTCIGCFADCVTDSLCISDSWSCNLLRTRMTSSLERTRSYSAPATMLVVTHSIVLRKRECERYKVQVISTAQVAWPPQVRLLVGCIHDQRHRRPCNRLVQIVQLWTQGRQGQRLHRAKDVLCNDRHTV